MVYYTSRKARDFKSHYRICTSVSKYALEKNIRKARSFQFEKEVR